MLNQNELEKYRLALSARRTEVENRISDLGDACEAVAPDQSLGRLTRNTAMQDQQVALHLRRQLELQRTRIHTALERIASGKFGLCVLCHQAIDTRRLDMLPESPLCIACLHKSEAKKASR